jgi:hypothetical protein
MNLGGVEPIKKYDQKVFLDVSKNQKGDQLVACIKTLIGEDLSLCNTDFSNGKNAWNSGFLNDLKKYYKAKLIQIEYTPKYIWEPLMPRFIIATGECNRHIACDRLGHAVVPTQHSVVWDHKLNKCWHDPHPSRAGLTRIDIVAWLVRI